jgi:hypothetical protein
VKTADAGAGGGGQHTLLLSLLSITRQLHVRAVLVPGRLFSSY